MSIGELAYLSMVIAAVLVFMATLAWVSRRDGNQERRTHRASTDPDRGHAKSSAVHVHR